MVPSLQSNKPRKRAAKPSVYHIQETSRDACPACDDNQHSIYQCPTFKGWSVERRATTAKKKQLCTNCGGGHAVDSCHSKRTCKECSGHHHTYLHKSTHPAASSAVESQNTQSSATCSIVCSPSVAQSYTFPRTALTVVTAGPYQQTARAMFDPGSTVSLITSRLASALKAPKKRSSVTIAGLTGKLTSSYQVEVDIGSIHDPGGEELPIIAHIVESITADSPEQDLDSVKQMPFLDGLQLADPTLGTGGRIDLLFSVTDCNRCMEDGQPTNIWWPRRHGSDGQSGVLLQALVPPVSATSPLLSTRTRTICCSSSGSWSEFRVKLHI